MEFQAGFSKYCNVFVGEFRGGQDSTTQNTKEEKGNDFQPLNNQH